MKDITIPATIGNKQVAVRVSFPHGAAGLGHIYIDNWYQGQIVKREAGWQVFLNERSKLSVEDSEALKEIVAKENDSALPNPGTVQ